MLKFVLIALLLPLGGFASEGYVSDSAVFELGKMDRYFNAYGRCVVRIEQGEDCWENHNIYGVLDQSNPPGIRRTYGCSIKLEVRQRGEANTHLQELSSISTEWENCVVCTFRRREVHESLREKVRVDLAEARRELTAGRYAHLLCR